MKLAGRNGFTLVELLVVIAIISILAAMLLPALEEARTSAMWTLCMNNTRQLNLTIITYATDSNGIIPPMTSFGVAEPPGSVLNCIQRNTAEDYPLFAWCPEYLDGKAMKDLACPVWRNSDPKGLTRLKPTWYSFVIEGRNMQAFAYVYLAQRCTDTTWTTGATKGPTSLSDSGSEPLLTDWNYLYSNTWRIGHVTQNGWYMTDPTGVLLESASLGANVNHLDGHTSRKQVDDLQLRHTRGGGMRFYW